MNSWKAVGIIFCLLGSFMLLIGVIAGLAAGTALSPFLDNSQLANQLRGTLFMAAASPWFLGCVPMFIIGFVGLYAGRDSNTAIVENLSPQNATTVEMQPPTITTNKSSSVASGKSKIVCGSCGVMNDIDAVFCKKCGNQFQ